MSCQQLTRFPAWLALSFRSHKVRNNLSFAQRLLLGNFRVALNDLSSHAVRAVVVCLRQFITAVRHSNAVTRVAHVIMVELRSSRLPLLPPRALSDGALYSILSVYVLNWWRRLGFYWRYAMRGVISVRLSFVIFIRCDICESRLLAFQIRLTLKPGSLCHWDIVDDARGRVQ